MNTINLKSLFDCKSTSSTQQPVVLEERELKAVAVDIYSRLLMDRIIVVGSEINQSTANTIMAQLIYLNSVDNKTPIQMFINSPGGDVISGLQIYDTMQMIKAPVYTICTGMAASMAAILLAGGNKGMRGALPNATIMIHQPMGGAFGQASDIAIANERIQFYKNKLYTILAEATDKPIEKIWEDCERDHWMSADEAKEYGLIDKKIDGKNIL